MAREEKSREARHGLNRLQALADPRIGLFILLYFTIALGTNGFGFYRPDDPQEALPRLAATTRSDCLYVIPNLATAVAMFLIGRHSDRTGERRWHLAAVCPAGRGRLGAERDPALALARRCSALTMAQVGMISMIGPFWSLVDLVHERHRRGRAGSR